MAPVSTFDIFKVGVGPSSSHTLGPWKAARQFLAVCRNVRIFERILRIKADLYGSLAKTGRGHGSDIAIVMGLHGEDPALCDVSQIHPQFTRTCASHRIALDRCQEIRFDAKTDLVFHRDSVLPYHPNGLRLTALLDDRESHAETYYSVGGGFIVQESQAREAEPGLVVPFSADTAAELLGQCREHSLTIPQVVWNNELAWRQPEAIHDGLQSLWSVMKACVYRGVTTDGILPGALGVVRRAARLNQKLLNGRAFQDVGEWLEAIRRGNPDFRQTLTWVTCFALAVNEENASFGRVVTAPTNGAAGVIPAVLLYYVCFCDGNDAGIEEFLLTAAEIAMLFKERSTISAAMGGCQAEIGVSSAMAAAGLAQVLGASPDRVLMAAEIAMEHHLGLTCDPVGGLVQIPCIERNTMGAIKAITSCYLALESDPSRARVPLDAVIRTMWATAQDMNVRYKETSEGGLAVQIPVSLSEC